MLHVRGFRTSTSGLSHSQYAHGEVNTFVVSRSGCHFHKVSWITQKLACTLFHVRFVTDRYKKMEQISNVLFFDQIHYFKSKIWQLRKKGVILFHFYLLFSRGMSILTKFRCNNLPEWMKSLRHTCMPRSWHRDLVTTYPRVAATVLPRSWVRVDVV